MTAPERRLADRIVDPSYVKDIHNRSLDELKHMRDECREAETELSFERRLCHARIDILRAELAGRRGGSGEDDLVARLPEILATDTPDPGDAPLPSRAPDLSIPRNADVPRRRVDEVVAEGMLARLAKLSSGEITSTIEALARHEKDVSERRKKIQDVMDAVQAAMVPRFQEKYPQAH